MGTSGGAASVLAAVCLGLALTGCARVGGEPFQPTLSRPIDLAPGDYWIGQSFQPATGAIAGVDVLVATYGRTPGPAGLLEMTLTNGVDGPVLASAAVSGEQLADNRWVRFRFQPPVDAPDVAVAEVRWNGQDRLALWANAPPPIATLDLDRAINDPYPHGRLLLAGSPAEGDLAFRVAGTGGAGAALEMIAEIAREAAGRLLGEQPAFAVAWLALLAAAVWLGVIRLRRSPEGRRASRELADSGPDEQRSRGDEAGT